MPAERMSPYHKRPYTALVQDMLQLLSSGVGGRTALTDTTEGSVMRTLVEVFAHELAVSYEQLDRVYRFGFLDTAEGPALDNVVAIVGIERRRAGHLEGEVTFSRVQPATAEMPIPAGTQVAGRDEPLFETVEPATLRQGDTRVQVTVRSVDPAGVAVPAQSLSLMPRPLAGIESLTNRNEILPRQHPESDAELRERARQVTRGGRRGTLTALREAPASLGIRSIAVNETGDGRVQVVLGDEDLDEATVKRARARVEAVRPAGIPVQVRQARRLRIGLSATLVLDRDGYRDEEQAAILGRVKADLLGYFNRLGLGDRVRWSKVRNILTTPDQVVEVEKTGGRPFMDPQGQTDGLDWNSLAGKRKHGEDIIPEADERLFSAPEWLQLSLEPPWVQTRVDLELSLKAGTNAENVEARTREALRNLFDRLPFDAPLSVAAIREALPDRDQVEQLELRVTREQDASVTLLDGSPGEEPVRPGRREEVRLGSLNLDGGGDG